MSTDPTRMGAYETLGLLACADRETVERRADALSALLKLGLAPPEGDAVQLPEASTRDAESVAEAARVLRDPERWLEESLFWPDCRTAGAALNMAAELLEGAAGRPSEPASLVRHLALEYLSEEVAKEQALGHPDQHIDALLAPPSKPPLYLGESPGGPDGSDDS